MSLQQIVSGDNATSQKSSPGNIVRLLSLCQRLKNVQYLWHQPINRAGLPLIELPGGHSRKEALRAYNVGENLDVGHFT